MDDEIPTDTIPNATATSNADLAVGGIYGPLSGTAEYIQNWVMRSENPALTFNGYVATVEYFLTGESELYNFQSDSIVGFTPIHHASGAWQVVLRYSDTNLSDQDVHGGSCQTLTTGLNWYPIAYLVVKTNYTRAHATNGFLNGNPNANIGVLEIQTVF